MNDQLTIFIAIVVVFLLYKKFKAIQIKKTLSVLNPNDIQLVDVRSENEFAAFSAPGSINIPVDSMIAGNTDGLKKEKVIVVYCASGVRSTNAAAWLKKAGYNVVNAGIVENVIQCIKI